MESFATLTIILLSSLVALANGQCYSYDTDIGSIDLNNGLNNKFNTAQECQAFCTTIATSAFFTWTDVTFSDPNYHYSCWCTPDNANSQVKVGSVSGPNYCGDSNVCCEKIMVASSGGITTSVQSHILGTYSRYSESANGHQNYKQDAIGGAFMYYYAPLGMWYIGEAIGFNAAYATNEGDAICSEQVQQLWDFWSPSTNSWIIDNTMTTYCV